jgi:hypothetical protein
MRSRTRAAQSFLQRQHGDASQPPQLLGWRKLDGWVVAQLAQDKPEKEQDGWFDTNDGRRESNWTITLKKPMR